MILLLILALLCAPSSAWAERFVTSGGGGSTHGNGANCSAGEIPLGVDANGAVEGCYEPTEADISDLSHTTDTNLTEEEVEDFVGGMLGGTETRISVTYDDAGNAIDYVVDDMNDDVPESGDFGAGADLDADGGITDGNVLEAHLKAVDAAADEECLTYESTGGDFEWQTCGGSAHGDGANCSAGEIPLGVDANGAVQGCYEPTEADISDLAHLTEEQVEDFVGGMLGGTETRISVTYDDAGNAIDYVVDDMNDDVPESGDFGNGADLDADGGITDGNVLEAHLKAVDAASDEECLTYESTGGDFEWQSCGSGSGATVDIVRKTADESVTSSTVLQNDDHLTFSVDASTTYQVTGHLEIDTSNATPDIVVAITLDNATGATVFVGILSLGNAGNLRYNETLDTSGTASARIPLPSTNSTDLIFSGIVITGSSTSSITLQWAQATSNGNAVTIFEGSHMTLTKE